VPPIPCPDIFRILALPLLTGKNESLSTDYAEKICEICVICGEIAPAPNSIMTTRRWIFFFISLALGLGLGLFYGWVFSPVQYTDTTPGALRIDYQADYTLMVAEVFQSDQNIDLAGQRMTALGTPAEIAAQALSFAQQNGYSSADIALLQNLLTALQVSQPAGANP
jgi:hypothetical protein